MKRLLLALPAAFLLGISLVGSSQADMETRGLRPEEKEFSVKILTAFSQALPQPLEGYKIDHPSPLVPPDSVPATGDNPMELSYSTAWVNPEQLEKERTEEDEAVASATAEQQNSNQGKERSSLLSEQSRLSSEIGQAQERGDMSKFQDLQFQASHVGERLAKINEEQQAAIRDMVKNLQKTGRLSFVLQANPLAWEQPADKAESQPPLAGHPVYLCHDAGPNHENSLSVFLGDWKTGSDADKVSLTLTPKSLPDTRVQSVVVTVYGDKDLGRQVLESFHWKNLEQLIH